MKDWLEKNYKGNNKAYLEDIKKSEQMFENVRYERRDYSHTTSLVRQMQFKRIGSSSMNYTNKVQSRLQEAYIMNYSSSQNNNNKKRNNLDNNDETNENSKDKSKDIHRTDINLNRSKTTNNQNKNCYIV